MFSITADGTLFYGGRKVGTIELKGSYAQGTNLEFVARGVDVRLPPSDLLSETVFLASFAAGSVVVEASPIKGLRPAPCSAILMSAGQGASHTTKGHTP